MSQTNSPEINPVTNRTLCGRNETCSAKHFVPKTSTELLMPKIDQLMTTSLCSAGEKIMTAST